MATVKQRSSLDGLPKQFVSSLRVLFDILDDEKTGFVKLSEIESRWKGEGVKGLPPGVVGSLQKVTPGNGLLSFERFVAGLKIALLRNKSSSDREKENQIPPTNTRHGQNFSKTKLNTLPGGAPVRHGLTATKPNQLNRATTTATVRPSNYSGPQRANSVPHLAGDDDEATTNHQFGHARSNDPRHRLVSEGGMPPVKNEITSVLKSWQRDRMMSAPQTNVQHHVHNYDASHAHPSGLKSASNIHTQQSGDKNEGAAMYRRTEPKKREPRRHTLGSGIDYNMIKRMKQLEHEKDMLLQGLEYIEKAKDWYHKQIAEVQEKQKYLSKSGHMETSSAERNQERINFLGARMSEVNLQLKALVESSEKGFPSHMNLAMRQQPMKPKTSEPDTNQATNMLKAQNRMLTKEVSQKSDRISQLERDKVALVRQLFEARSKDNRKPYSDDTTFM